MEKQREPSFSISYHLSDFLYRKERMRYLLTGFSNTDGNPGVRISKLTGKTSKPQSVQKKTRIVLNMPQTPKTSVKRDRSEFPVSKPPAKKRKTVDTPTNSLPPSKEVESALTAWFESGILESANLTAQEREELEEEITNEELDKMFDDVKMLEQSVVSDEIDWCLHPWM